MKKIENNNKNKLYELKNQAIGINMLSLESKDALKKMISYGKTHSFITIKFFGSGSCPPCKQLKKLLIEDGGNYWNNFIKQNWLKKMIGYVLKKLGAEIDFNVSDVKMDMNAIVCQDEIKKILQKHSITEILELLDQHLILSLLFFDVSELSGYEEFKNYSLDGIPSVIGTIIHQNENVTDSFLDQTVGYRGQEYLETGLINIIKLGLYKFFNNNFIFLFH